MFTGIVQALGHLDRVESADDGARIWVSSALVAELSPGDSIAVDGVCLTATRISDHSFSADVMNETLSRSALGFMTPGVEVNLELPLRPSDRLGGHVVQGHVDAIGTVLGVFDDGFARQLEIEAPAEVLRYLVEKGSVAVRGVSLTVAELKQRSFTVSLIPETLARTNLGGVQAGTKVNLEVDVLAKYVERLIETRR